MGPDPLFSSGSTFLSTLVTAQDSLPPGRGYMVMGCSTVFSATFLSLTLHLAYTSPATQTLEEFPLLWELSQTCYHRKEKAHTHSEQRNTLRLQYWGTQDSSLRRWDGGSMWPGEVHDACRLLAQSRGKQHDWNGTLVLWCKCSFLLIVCFQLLLSVLYVEYRIRI